MVDDSAKTITVSTDNFAKAGNYKIFYAASLEDYPSNISFSTLIEAYEQIVQDRCSAVANLQIDFVTPNDPDKYYYTGEQLFYGYAPAFFIQSA